jgi:hypothetical protein
MADSVIALTCFPRPPDQIHQSLPSELRIHVETHQTSVSSVHIVFLERDVHIQSSRNLHKTGGHRFYPHNARHG